MHLNRSYNILDSRHFEISQLQQLQRNFFYFFRYSLFFHFVFLIYLSFFSYLFVVEKIKKRVKNNKLFTKITVTGYSKIVYGLKRAFNTNNNFPYKQQRFHP